MARSRKQRRFAINFELGIFGFMGLGIVTFCIFLWMFLLGIWAGQTVLLPEAGSATKGGLTKLATSILQKQATMGAKLKAGAGNGEAADEEGAGSPVKTGSAKEASYFSLQVAEFPEEKKAMLAMSTWRARGHESFYIKADDETGLYRVYVGKYEDISQAYNKVAEFESQNQRVYITLLPGSKIPKN